MLKIAINSSHDWLENIVKQVFKEIEISNAKAKSEVTDDVIFINDCIAHLEFSLKKQSDSWKINKPIFLFELVKTIDQLQNIFLDKHVLIGPLVFYPNQRFCIINECKIELTQKEADIIMFLAQFDNFVSKSEILKKIWGYSDDISTKTLETHIYKLRQKFTDFFELIISNENGYQLNKS